MAIPFLPPSLTPRPPLIPRLPPRRRGGQPSNHNAVRHGYYSRRPPEPLAKLSRAIGRYRQIMLESDPVALAGAIQDLHGQIDILAVLCRTLLDSGQTSLFMAVHKLFLKTICASMQLKIIMHKLRQPIHDLQFVAGRPLDLITYDFWEHRITRDADSFRSGLKKMYLNSLPLLEPLLPSFFEPDFPFLTPYQTQLLQPFLPVLKEVAWPTQSADTSECSLGVSPERSDRRERSRRGRGRPPADPSEMLDAIFWKMAHHARWQELPVGYPSMAACRRYYRRIFYSGRLLTIYRALYKDLCTRGRVDLAALVEQDCFSIQANKVALRPGLQETWQMRTALLFMQQGYFMLRHLNRVNDQESRRRLPHFDSFIVDRLGRVRKSSTRSSDVRPLSPEPEFSFNFLD